MQQATFSFPLSVSLFCFFPPPPLRTISFVIVWLLSRTLFCHVTASVISNVSLIVRFCSRDAVAARSMILGDDEVVAPVRARVDRVFLIDDDQVAPALAYSF